jgi:hypothetical protein
MGALSGCASLVQSTLASIFTILVVLRLHQITPGFVALMLRKINQRVISCTGQVLGLSVEEGDIGLLIFLLLFFSMVTRLRVQRSIWHQ